MGGSLICYQCANSITKRCIFLCADQLLPVTMCSCQSKSAVSALGVVERDSPVHGVHVGISTFRQQETHQLVVPSGGGQLQRSLGEVLLAWLHRTLHIGSSF